MKWRLVLNGKFEFLSLPLTVRKVLSKNGSKLFNFFVDETFCSFHKESKSHANLLSRAFLIRNSVVNCSSLVVMYLCCVILLPE